MGHRRRVEFSSSVSISPEIIQNLVSENFKFQFSLGTLSDGDWEGFSVPGTLGATIAFGELCYYNSATNVWLKANANSINTSSGELGYCLISGDNADSSAFLQIGIIRSDSNFSGLSAGPVYISADTAGAVTSTAPSGTEDFVVRKVGFQRGSNTIAVAGISGNVSTVAGISADVSTVAGIAADVTTVAGIHANVTTVSGVAANVTTVAGISADVSTVVGISADVTAVAAIATEIQAANYFSRKNHIINGNFDVWQRGTSFTEADPHGADRWRIGTFTSTVVATQQAFTLGQTDVPNNPRYFYRTVIASGETAGSYAMQGNRIEFVKTLSGLVATLSFYAKADAAKNMAVEFTQAFGAGGSPSALITAIGATKIALTTSWQKFTVTVAIPSISGKTIGTNLNDYLGVNFWFDAGSDHNSRTDSLGNQSGTFDIAQVQLEQGSVATTFEPRTYGEELALCQRYYWQGYASQAVGSRHVAAAINGCVGAIGSFPVAMRIPPTMAIITAPTYASCSHYDIYATPTGFVHRVATAAAAQYQISTGVYSALAEL